MKICIVFIAILINACGAKLTKDSYKGSISPAGYQADTLAKPYDTKSSKNFSKVIGWKENETPTAPVGFVVTKFAKELDHPRWIYIGPNDEIFVAEANTELKGIKKIGSKISRKI